MPKIAEADLMLEIENFLVGTGRDETRESPQIQELRRSLAKHAARIRFLSAEQRRLIASKQEVTQALRIAKSQASELLTVLRIAIKAKLGHRNERLVKYNIRPTRRRSRRTVESEAIVPTVAVPDLTDDVAELLARVDRSAARSATPPQPAPASADES